MKPQFILGFCITLFSSSLASFAQKVDLDRYSFNVSYQQLPKEFVPLEKRTYGAKVTVGSSVRSYMDDAALYDGIKIYGWKKVESSPTVGIDMNLESFIFKDASLKSETTEQKDKEGKVTSRTTSYWILATYEARGSSYIKGPFTPKQPSEKELLEQKKKEEAKSNNRFLASVTVNKEPEVTNGFNVRHNNVYTYATESSTSSSTVNSAFQNKKDAIYSDQLKNFVNGSLAAVNNNLNFYYGFSPIQKNDYLWILNSKDHPEYQTQQEAIQAVKELFKTMKVDQPITELESNLSPLIDYLQSLKTKYKGDDKRNKKMRYSAYYNLSKIYYYLDKPEKAREEAEGLIKNEYDEKDGESLVQMANELAESMKIAKTNTRHNPELK
ncbi:hypothetical protein [Emticicia sp. TH156]|uniref:hypothetical protein n=1 Tax=Emticicia sp. TH156 TaxID=2067454 RepID=UPI000C775E3C|nr:hypothetical protein [Emticicia sp. TH156]PLK43177.1 hypothetical protein C0V77_17540 [Emticicia sp. TH156]